MDLEGFDVETFMEMVNAAGLKFHKTCDEREDAASCMHNVLKSHKKGKLEMIQLGRCAYIQWICIDTVYINRYNKLFSFSINMPF